MYNSLPRGASLRGLFVADTTQASGTDTQVLHVFFILSIRSNKTAGTRGRPVVLSCHGPIYLYI